MFCCPSVYSASSYQVLSLLSMSLHLSIDVLIHPHQLSRGVTYSMSLMKWKYSYFNFFIFQLLTSLSHFYFLSSALTLSLSIYICIYIYLPPPLFFPLSFLLSYSYSPTSSPPLCFHGMSYVVLGLQDGDQSGSS